MQPIPFIYRFIRGRVFRGHRWFPVSLIVGSLGACSLTDLPDPSSIIDPAIVETPAGAIGLYQNALSRFNSIFAVGQAFGIDYSYVVASGLGSDEFSTNLQSRYALRRMGLDGISTVPGEIELVEPWLSMHRARLQIDQAIGALKKYGTTAPTSYVPQLYALRGYLSIMFGELYCSGVPFSRAVYGGDLVTGRPLTTTQMFEQAIAEFDSALAVPTDTIRIRQLATLGKARALVNLNRAADAAALVTGIPTNFHYSVRFAAGGPQNYTVGNGLRMANRLGANGLDYLAAGTNGDPRVASYSSPMLLALPAKFPSSFSPVALTDGLEARLIEAEARLRADDVPAWASILNDLRANTITGLSPLPSDSTLTASVTLRENVMFRERAFWLYGTGRRFGDMRRLVRQYNRPFQTVFPAGMHPDLITPDKVFSSFANFAPPLSEITDNPYFSGCFNREA